MAALLAASLIYTPVPLLLVIALPAVFFYLTRPYPLLLLMVFLIPFNFVFKVGPIPLAAELLKVFAWVPFLIALAAGRQSFKTSRHNWAFAVLGGLVILSLFRSNDLPFTFKEALRLVFNLGFCYLLINLVDSREKVVQVFKVLACSTFLVACYGFYQFAIQDFGALFWIVNPRIDTSLSHGRDVFWEWRNRITSVLTSEMELGHYFNLCLPVSLALWLGEGRRRLLSPWLWIALATLAGLLLTFTFGAWLALLITAAAFILVFSWNQHRKMVAAGGLVLLLAGWLVWFGPLRPLVQARLSGDAIGGLAWDVYTRWASWALALRAWSSHPLIGIGYGNFPYLSVGNLPFLTRAWTASGSSPHNIYVFLLAELGVLGLGAVLLIVLRTLRSNFQLRKSPPLGGIALALLFGLTTAFIGGCLDDSPLYGPHTSYLVWLFIGLSEALLAIAGPVSAAAKGRE